MKTDIVNTLQIELKKTILKTRLLYRFDRINKVNIHEYFDGLKNIIVIVKTKSGQHIAAFSEDPFLKNHIATGKGFIFALTERKVFGLNTKNKLTKAIIYDDFYMIFGNSELRIKTGDNKIFSNFGIINNFYETKGETVNSIMGEGEKTREVLL